MTNFSRPGTPYGRSSKLVSKDEDTTIIKGTSVELERHCYKYETWLETHQLNININSIAKLIPRSATLINRSNHPRPKTPQNHIQSQHVSRKTSGSRTGRSQRKVRRVLQWNLQYEAIEGSCN